MNMKAIAERSAETWALVNVLQGVAELQVIPYVDLAGVLGMDPQKEGRHYVRAACEILAREAGIEFLAVVNVGLKRADDVLKVSLGRHRLRKAVRQAKRSRRALAAVEKWEALPEEKKREHNILAAQAGAIQALTSPKADRLLDRKLERAQERMAEPGASLKLMAETL